jgi:hypothetical protein
LVLLGSPVHHSQALPTKVRTPSRDHAQERDVADSWFLNPNRPLIIDFLFDMDAMGISTFSSASAFLQAVQVAQGLSSGSESGP